MKRTISTKIISLVLVLTLMFSLCATTIGAVTADNNDGKFATNSNDDKKLYVSIGDSMTNGYGLEGYEEWNESKGDYDNYFGFLVNTPDACPNKVATTMGWDLIQLATSGLRADDIYYLLNYGTENAVEWDDYGTLYMVDKFDNTFSGSFDEVVAQAAAVYQQAIKDADVISVNVGSNNFATLIHLRISYLLAQITGNTAMFGGYSGEFDFNELVGDLKPEQKAEIEKLYNELEEELFAYAAEAEIDTELVLNPNTGVTMGYILEDLAHTFAYSTAGFVLGFAGIMETINRENPDAEVIVVELTNWFSGRVFEIPLGDDVITINVGDILDELYNFANTYMEVISAQYSTGTAVDKTHAQKIYFAEVDDVELIVDEIVSKSNIDLESLYEIEDEDDRFTAAKIIAESINSSVIPAGSVRARLLRFLNSYVLSGFIGRHNVASLAQVEAAVAAIADYYADDFSINIGYGDMNREAFEAAFATFPDCEGQFGGNCPYPYCQTCIGSPLNMYLGGFRPDVTNLGGCLAYLGLEKSMIASLSYDAINVSHLALAESMADLMYAAANALDGHMSGMDDVAAAMIASPELMTISNMLFSLMVGDGAILHPSVAGHETIADAIVEAYTEANAPSKDIVAVLYDMVNTEYLTAEEKVKCLEYIYSFVECTDIIPGFAGANVVEEIYCYLTSSSYVTDAQIVRIILLLLDACKDDSSISYDEIREIVGEIYFDVFVIADADGSEGVPMTPGVKLDILEDVYNILKDNGILPATSALDVIEELYNSISDEKLLADEHLLNVVDKVVLAFVNEPQLTNEVIKNASVEIVESILANPDIPSENKSVILDLIVDAVNKLTGQNDIVKDAASINVKEVDARGGSIVEVTIDIENNPGILGAILTLSYDPALELLDVTVGGALSTLDFTQPGRYENVCNFVWDGVYDADYSDGTILKLTFKVPDSASIGDVYNIGVSYTYGNVVDENNEPIALIITNGSINIKPLIGDVNDDGVVDVADVVTLRRYFAGGYDAVIHQIQSDVNEDGEINVSDIIELRRYIVNT